MEGPWYTLDDAQEKLGINRSELCYLINEGHIQPVVYTRSRRFLLFRSKSEGWTGYASCDYRGHLSLHHSSITQLMDGVELTVSTGSGILCEEQGVSNWASAYPFKKPLPHGPLLNWIPIEQGSTALSNYAATPFPKEGESTIDNVQRTMDAIQKSSSDGFTTKPIEHLTNTKPQLSLSFIENSLFIPDNLRIPASELTRYQRASAVEAAIDPEVNQTSNKRENQLHTLIERIVRENPDITAKEAWRLIEHDCDADEPLFDHDPILLMVDSHCIEWQSRHGRKRSMKHLSFVSQLTKTKKKIAMQ